MTCLFEAVIWVVEFPINTFKGTIGLVRVLDNEWLWKIIIELSDEFWNWLQSYKHTGRLNRLSGTHRQLEWLVSKNVHLVVSWHWILDGVSRKRVTVQARTRLWHRSSKQLSWESGHVKGIWPLAQRSWSRHHFNRVFVSMFDNLILKVDTVVLAGSLDNYLTMNLRDYYSSRLLGRKPRKKLSWYLV